MIESLSVDSRTILFISSNGFVVKSGSSSGKICRSVFFAPCVWLTSLYVQIVSGTSPGCTSERNRLMEGT